MLSHPRTVVNSTGTDRPGKRKVPACSAWSAWFLQPHGLAPFGAKHGGVKNHEKYAKYGKYVGQGLSRGSFPQDASDGTVPCWPCGPRASLRSAPLSVSFADSSPAGGAGAACVSRREAASDQCSSRQHLLDTTYLPYMAGRNFGSPCGGAGGAPATPERGACGRRHRHALRTVRPDSLMMVMLGLPRFPSGFTTVFLSSGSTCRSSASRVLL